eukprot:6183583-Pleurochrysis_carterae.AAC.1
MGPLNSTCQQVKKYAISWFRPKVACLMSTSHAFAFLRPAPLHDLLAHVQMNLGEASQTFEELSKVIDAKADAAETSSALERKVGRAEMQSALNLKADVSEVQRCLDEKANVDEASYCFHATLQ